MLRRLFVLCLIVGLEACSGSIHDVDTISGAWPKAITVDARQRVLLSQTDPTAGYNKGYPPYRRYCAEPSPDVFTVLGVAASGSGSFSHSADKSVNAALQAAFSSSETGATIARTQTVNMLREMMFRTCERYLSGAISAEEFPIIAARDQRIMVSILAIEQLTGSVTPRALSINSGGNGSTGMDPTELVKALGDAQTALTAAESDLAVQTKKQTDADTPPGTCAAIRQKNSAGTPALTADETNKLKDCDDADAAYAASKAKRDAAKEYYETLVNVGRGGIGVSSAASSTNTEFAPETDRAAAVSDVAKAVQNIVLDTFNQDETQLFCIRVLYPGASTPQNPDLQTQCRSYLMARVAADRNKLAFKYGLSPAEYETDFNTGVVGASRTETLAIALHRCAVDPTRAHDFEGLVTNASILGDGKQAFLTAARAGAAYLEEQLRRAGPVAEQQIASSFAALCGENGNL